MARRVEKGRQGQKRPHWCWTSQSGLHVGQPCFLSDCLWTAGGRVLDDLQVSFDLCPGAAWRTAGASFGFACDRLCFVAMGTVGSEGVAAEPGSSGVGVAMLLALALAWRLNESGCRGGLSGGYRGLHGSWSPWFLVPLSVSL